MKLFGLYISSVNYAEKYIIAESNLRTAEETAKRTKRECEEAHNAYTELAERYNIVYKRLRDIEDEIITRNEDIKELRSQLEDIKSAKTELSERLEKEQSDNCELQNLYSDKCKECDALDDKLALVNADLDKLTKEKEIQDGDKGGCAMVTVEVEYLERLKEDAEKFRAERAKHNENRRKRRAAKKVAHGKPE